MKKLMYPLIVAIVAWAANAAAADFSYYPPGELFPGSGQGRINDRHIYIPGIAFPLIVGVTNNAHAYAGSQIFNVRGGSSNALENYVYPWRDDYCEKRSWNMPMCPAGTGHQGVDIRPSSNKDSYWQAVAMDDGLVTSVTANTTVTIRSDNGFYCRYLHMSSQSIKEAGIKPGVRVRKGVTIIGKVSNIMGGTPNTSIHLHFDCNKRVANTAMFVPVYASLISAYRAAWQLPSVDSADDLGIDGEREVGKQDTADNCADLGDSIGTEKKFRFASYWMHDCSLMGLVVDGNERQFVYVRPRASIRALVESDPVLFSGTFTKEKYVGTSRLYSTKCGNLTFDVDGPISSDFRAVSLSGSQPIRDDACALIRTKLVQIPFAYYGTTSSMAEVTSNDADVPPEIVQTKAEAPIDITSLLFDNVIDRAFPSMSARWINPNIPVCWENPSAASLQDRLLIQAAAHDTWDRFSALNFTGWQACVSGNKGIRIRVEDSGPHTKGLGNQLDGKLNGMVLNTTFASWSPVCSQSETRRQSCIYSIAVHEFGHAIGFAHEQNRADTPGECTKKPQGSDGDNTTLTPYDPSSTMNYCNPVYNNDGRLSAWDKYALQYMYGRG